jgi:hypothetical protein
LDAIRVLTKIVDEAFQFIKKHVWRSATVVHADYSQQGTPISFAIYDEAVSSRAALSTSEDKSAGF